ncbi:hypothetical protein GGR57DRAFT_506086 [Xylariaceae sp. FL1272]|nr:hypothetical protein GGR57DRAFT_506086 [Xylariaceae sp. FL1272]
MLELLVLPIIASHGFGQQGPVLGSWAASCQAFFYGAAVPAGSLLTILESLNMTSR